MGLTETVAYQLAKAIFTKFPEESREKSEIHGKNSAGTAKAIFGVAARSRGDVSTNYASACTSVRISDVSATGSN